MRERRFCVYMEAPSFCPDPRDALETNHASAYMGRYQAIALPRVTVGARWGSSV